MYSAASLQYDILALLFISDLLVWVQLWESPIVYLENCRFVFSRSMSMRTKMQHKIAWRIEKCTNCFERICINKVNQSKVANVFVCNKYTIFSIAGTVASRSSTGIFQTGGYKFPSEFFSRTFSEQNCS